MFWPVKDWVVLANVLEIALPSWRMTLQCFLSYFFKDFWQTNSYVPFRIDCSTILLRHCNYSYMPIYPKKIKDNLLQSASYANNFSWVWLNLKNPCSWLLFNFSLKHIDLFITCIHHVIHSFWCTTILFFEHFFAPIDTRIFLSDCQSMQNTTCTNLSQD